MSRGRRWERRCGTHRLASHHGRHASYRGRHRSHRGRHRSHRHRESRRRHHGRHRLWHMPRRTEPSRNPITAAHAVNFHIRFMNVVIAPPVTPIPQRSFARKIGLHVSGKRHGHLSGLGDGQAVECGARTSSDFVNVKNEPLRRHRPLFCPTPASRLQNLDFKGRAAAEARAPPVCPGLRRAVNELVP